MIKVLQDKLLPPHGNCMDACMASIFEIKLSDCPNYSPNNPDWWERIEEFVNSKGFDLLIGYRPDANIVPKGCQIAVVDSPRGPWLHAVVALDGVIVWDPHPDQDSYGLPIKEYDLIIKKGELVKWIQI